ncbi:MAG: TIGR03067 domain-containing protein [Planctomycetota bacterium]|nr:TIGR03067 domain-containing protein [Planctomycetota bacterium]
MNLPLAAKFVILLALASTAYGGSSDGAAQVTSEAAERSKLVGVWKGFTVEGKGENPDRGPVKLEITITEKTMHGIQIQDDKRIDHGEGQFTLDLSADPFQLDAAQSLQGGRKRAYIGIYQLDGDVLKWCVSPQKVRPTTFETKKGQFLLILKRERK